MHEEPPSAHKEMLAFLEEHKDEDEATLKRMLADFLANRAAKSAGKGQGMLQGKGKGQVPSPALCDRPAKAPKGGKGVKQEPDSGPQQLKRLRHLTTSECLPDEKSAQKSKTKKLEEPPEKTSKKGQSPEEPVKPKSKKTTEEEEAVKSQKPVGDKSKKTAEELAKQNKTQKTCPENDKKTKKKKQSDPEENEEPVQVKTKKKKHSDPQDVEEADQEKKTKKKKQSDPQDVEEPDQEKTTKKKKHSDPQDDEEPVQEKTKTKKKRGVEESEPVQEIMEKPLKSSKKDPRPEQAQNGETKMKDKVKAEAPPEKKKKHTQPPAEDNELESEELGNTEEEADTKEFWETIRAARQQKEALKAGGTRIYDLKAVTRVPKFGGAPYDQPYCCTTPKRYTQLTLHDLDTVRFSSPKGASEGKGQGKKATPAEAGGSKLACEFGLKFYVRLLGATQPLLGAHLLVAKR